MLGEWEDVYKAHHHKDISESNNSHKGQGPADGVGAASSSGEGRSSGGGAAAGEGRGRQRARRISRQLIMHKLSLYPLASFAKSFFRVLATSRRITEGHYPEKGLKNPEFRIRNSNFRLGWID